MRKFSRLKIKKNPAIWFAEILILTVLTISMPVYAEETVTESLSGNNNDVQNELEYSASIKITYSVETEPETRTIPVEQPDGSTKAYTEESETETTKETGTHSELERRFAETWDNSRMFLWLSIGCIALIVLVISCIKIKRKELRK